MDTERNLLFGVVAFQNGAVDADRLAETCADWVSQQTRPLADLMVDRGLMTDEQRTEVEKAVSQELASHGGDPHATLAATMDGRSREAIGEIAGAGGLDLLEANGAPAQLQGGHVVLGTLSPEADGRERYTLTHLHAKGGMGRVWLARDGALGRQIALKELRPDQSDNSIICSRFLYEAKITAQLEHPSIVPVYELGEGDAPYYTMRFVRGRTLSEAVRAYHKRRAAGEADLVGMVDLLSNFASVCHAVAYAHSRGIIHRDLKGQNVVLGDFGEVIVLDWGLAKRVGPDQLLSQPEGAAPADPAADPVSPEAGTAVTCAAGIDDAFAAPEPIEDRIPGSSAPGASSDHGPSSNGSAHLGSNAGNRRLPESGAGPEGTMQGQLLGTPAYMAPEQAQGRHDLVDQRTDIYGLGAILYEILTGRPPFVAPKTAEVIRKVCQEAPTPPRQIVPQIAPGLEAVCLKALRKDKAERYATAAELAQEVRRWLADEPVKAYPEPWTQRASRWARRHKTSVAAAAVLIVTATIALGVSTLLVSQERNEAEAQGQQARQAVHLLTKVADIGFDEQLDPLQEEFLKNALAYYEQFTGRASRDPSVRLEHGRAFQQMGDIQRKLGRLPESETSYRKAVEMLQPLAAAAGAGHGAKQSLARTRTLLADLLVRRGADKGQAEPLYGQALDAQRALADVKQDPAAATEDILRLGQTLKSQGDLLRLNGKFSQAGTTYDQAIAELERAHADDAKNAEIRDDMALAVEARGWIHRERGDLPNCEKDYRRALDLLDKLVAEFPTVPRHRESLAKACNSLGILYQETGRLDEAEVHLRREIPLVERLSQDFPDRPEYRREQARALNVFGGVLRLRGQVAEAAPALRKAIDLDTAILAKTPDDVLVRFQLAMAHHHLGDILLKQGKPQEAIAAIRKSQAINEALAKEFPDKPSYSSDLAVNFDSLALALVAAGQPGADESFRAANAIYERLIAAHPEQVDYQIWQANCLRNQGAVLTDAGKADQAEAILHRALTRLETKDPKLQTPDRLRKQAEVLSNLGRLHRKGAEEDFRKSIAISEKLLAGQGSTINDRYNLAIAQNNLADFLSPDQRPALAIAPNEAAGPPVIAPDRIPEAGPYFAQSVANLDKVVAEVPKSLEFQYVFGIVLDGQAEWLDRTGKPADARAALMAAVEHQRQAVRLSNGAPFCGLKLAEHLIHLAEIDRKLGIYEEAARLALEVPKTVPTASRPLACLDASRVLARLVAQAGADDKVPQAERDRLSRLYLTRTVVLLREAIDSNPKLAEQIKADRDIKILESRPLFQTIMNTLVDLEK
jgi:eukaryotic-like serine/threonine-protein kinase